MRVNAYRSFILSSCNRYPLDAKFWKKYLLDTNYVNRYQKRTFPFFQCSIQIIWSSGFPSRGIWEYWREDEDCTQTSQAMNRPEGSRLTIYTHVGGQFSARKSTSHNINFWISLCLSKKQPYLSQMVDNKKIEGTSLSQTLKLRENKVASEFGFLADWLRYGRFYIFKNGN